MRTNAKRLTTALAFGLCFPTLAQAQPFLNVSPITFKRPPVQRELKLQPHQIERAVALAEAMRNGVGETSQEYINSGGGPAAREVMRKKNREIERTYVKDLAAILEPDQMRRLREIDFQKMGLYAFGDPELRDELKLTTEQVSEFEKLAREKTQRNREYMETRRMLGNAPVDREMMNKVAKEKNLAEAESIRTVLNAKQKNEWAKKVGEPFDEFDPSSP